MASHGERVLGVPHAVLSFESDILTHLRTMVGPLSEMHVWGLPGIDDDTRDAYLRELFKLLHGEQTGGDGDPAAYPAIAKVFGLQPPWATAKVDGHHDNCVRWALDSVGITFRRLLAQAVMKCVEVR